MICTVSMPEISSKNQPQEVYMSWVWRSSSSSSKTVTRSAAVRVAGGVGGEEAVEVVGGAIEHDVDVGVAGGPEIFEQRLGDGFGERCGAVAEEVEGFAQGAAPCWFQPGLPPLQPQSERQRSTPWEQDQEVLSTTSASHVGGKFLEELAVVGEAWRGCCPRSSAGRS